jgi:hypothetical protein
VRCVREEGTIWLILQVFDFFNTGKGGSIEDDSFAPLVALNYEIPLCFDWFNKIWNLEFPFLCTESDSPQCPECYNWDEKIRKALEEKDTPRYHRLKNNKNKHLEEASAVFKFQEAYRIRSKNYPNTQAILIDNMASKNIPKYRKEKADAWSKDKLTVHLGGSYSYNDDTVNYLLYPELANESANTILTQIDLILRNLRSREKQLHEVVFIFDNHSTQKNSCVLAYFEWQAKRGFITKDGMAT